MYHTSQVQAYLQILARRGLPKESNRTVGVGRLVALEVGACLHLSSSPSPPSALREAKSSSSRQLLPPEQRSASLGLSLPEAKAGAGCSATPAPPCSAKGYRAAPCTLLPHPLLFSPDLRVTSTRQTVCFKKLAVFISEYRYISLLQLFFFIDVGRVSTLIFANNRLILQHTSVNDDC